MKNNNYPLLDKVNSPLDLRKLDSSELKLLADDDALNEPLINPSPLLFFTDGKN